MPVPTTTDAAPPTIRQFPDDIARDPPPPPAPRSSGGHAPEHHVEQINPAVHPVRLEKPRDAQPAVEGRSAADRLHHQRARSRVQDGGDAQADRDLLIAVADR